MAQEPGLTECHFFRIAEIKTSRPDKKFIIELHFGSAGDCFQVSGYIWNPLFSECAFILVKRPWLTWTLKMSDIKDWLVSTGSITTEIEEYENQRGFSSQDIHRIRLVEVEPGQSFSIIMSYYNVNFPG